MRGERAPIVGQISMDQAMVDVTAIPAAVLGDPVTVIGRDGSQSIAVGELAERAGTIPWEILTGLGRRVERVAASRPAGEAGA